jgi:hypothetical protein
MACPVLHNLDVKKCNSGLLPVTPCITLKETTKERIERTVIFCHQPGFLFRNWTKASANKMDAQINRAILIGQSSLRLTAYLQKRLEN